MRRGQGAGTQRTRAQQSRREPGADYVKEWCEVAHEAEGWRRWERGLLEVAARPTTRQSNPKHAHSKFLCFTPGKAAGKLFHVEASK